MSNAINPAFMAGLGTIGTAGGSGMTASNLLDPAILKAIKTPIVLPPIVTEEIAATAELVQVLEETQSKPVSKKKQKGHKRRGCTHNLGNDLKAVAVDKEIPYWQAAAQYGLVAQATHPEIEKREAYLKKCQERREQRNG